MRSTRHLRFALSAWIALPAARAVAAPATRPASSQAPIEVTTEKNKPFTHAFSRFIFPFNVAAFRRANVYQFGDRNENVAVGYSDPALKIILTVNVSPVEDHTLDAHSRRVRSVFERAHPTAKATSQGELNVKQGDRQSVVRKVVYEYIGKLGGVEQDLATEIHLLACGELFVQYRAVYPAADQKAARTRIDTFIQLLSLPAPPPATRATTRAINQVQ